MAWFSGAAIATGLPLRTVVHPVPCQMERLLGTVLQLLGLDLAVLDHAIPDPRTERLDVPRPRSGVPSPAPVGLYSEGLKPGSSGGWLTAAWPQDVTVLTEAQRRRGCRHWTVRGLEPDRQRGRQRLPGWARPRPGPRAQSCRSRATMPATGRTCTRPFPGVMPRRPSCVPPRRDAVRPTRPAKRGRHHAAHPLPEGNRRHPTGRTRTGFSRPWSPSPPVPRTGPPDADAQDPSVSLQPRHVRG